MIAFKTIGKEAAILSLTLMAATVAHAQGLTTTTGSTDMYTINFQQAFASGRVILGDPGAPVGTGSTDIYGTDFQRAFATDSSVKEPRDTAAYRGSTDIYSTDFQNSFL
jgi:hypothetical protein